MTDNFSDSNAPATAPVSVLARLDDGTFNIRQGAHVIELCPEQVSELVDELQRRLQLMAYGFPYLCKLDAQGRVRSDAPRAHCEEEIETLVTRSTSRREERERARIALRVELGDISADERDAL